MMEVVTIRGSKKLVRDGARYYWKGRVVGKRRTSQLFDDITLALRAKYLDKLVWK